MPVINTANSKAKIKQLTGADMPITSSQPVMAKYGPVDSTAGQTVINLTFSVDTTASSIFFLAINGQIMAEGKDFNFTSIATDRTSSQVTLTFPLAAQQTIQAWKLGLKKESEFQTDNRFVASYDYLNQGFQPFVTQNNYLSATTTTGTPAIGRFHSTVINRAPINDFTQDMKVMLGIERFIAQNLSVIQGEMGPNGEPVYGVVGDTANAVRLVGNWGSWNYADGQGVSSNQNGANTTDYVEITFYGTGLNILVSPGFYSARDYRYSVNGGAEVGTSLVPSLPTPILSQRNYSANVLVPVVSGLALGTYTVKIRNNNSTNGIYLQGWEIVREASSLNVNPGTVYSAGQKIALSALTSSAYSSGFESGTLGTRGGHVVVYQKSDGSIAKAVTPTNAAALYLSNADHANEEVQRTHHWREFGAGRADDFSYMLNTGTTSRAFTLDDGTTTLVGYQVNAGVANNIEGLVFTASSPSFYTFTFVGTGLDIVRYEDITGTAAALAISIDGVSVGNMDTATVAGRHKVNKIASGLPYGTHVVRIAYPGSGASGVITKFVVYQPKKPAVPSGATELADYNIMATYSANATQGIDNISTGVLRKVCSREFLYFDNNNTSAFVINSSTLDIAGQAVVVGSGTPTANSYVQYTFFGTGFEFRGYGATGWSNSIQVLLNGNLLTSTYYSTLTGGGSLASNYSAYGFYSFNPATGIFSQAGGTGGGNGFRVTGLPLGLYTIRFNTTTAAQIGINTLDVITPIHSAKQVSYGIQNVNAVGSWGISDNRKTTPVKDVLPVTKNAASCQGVVSAPSTTSTSMVPMTDMNVNLKVNSNMIRISYCAQVGVNAATYVNLVLYVDGQPVETLKSVFIASAGSSTVAVNTILVPVSPGYHSVQLYWSTNTGTATAFGTQRNMIVEEK